MDGQSGIFFYRVTTILAGFIATLAVISYFFNESRGMPIISIAALAVAVVIWLSGWAGRHLIARR